MPVQQQAEKTEHEQKHWTAIKRHILNERKRKREEMEAEVEEERQRKEREANKKRTAMTLGETKEQIQLLERKLDDLKKEKEQMFVKLKEVMNKEANMKRQSEREVPQEMFPVVSKPAPHMQPMFLPPRPTVYQPPPPPSGSVVSHLGGLPMPSSVKRKQSPSPQSNSVPPQHAQPPPIAYHRQPPGVEATLLAQQRGDDHRRTNDGRAVLWTSKPTLLRHDASMGGAYVTDQLQYRPGAIPGYPPSGAPQSGPPKQQMYPFPITIRPGYHLDMMPPGQHPQAPHHQVSSQHPQSMKPDVQIKSSMPASIYHIDSRQLQKPPDRHVSYHPADMKQHDDRPELRQSHYDLANMRRDQIHLYPNPNLLQLSQQGQVVKTGSITQGYPTRSPGSNQPPPHPQHPQHYQNIIQSKNSFHRY